MAPHGCSYRGPIHLFFCSSEFSLGLKSVILDALSALLAGFVAGSGFLDVSSVILAGSLLKLMRSAPRSGNQV